MVVVVRKKVVKWALAKMTLQELYQLRRDAMATADKRLAIRFGLEEG